MTNITLIAAMANNRVIGLCGDMPWHLPADLKYFKQKTLSKPVIMGRKTFESIGQPLPKRQNIIITRNKTYTKDGVDIVHSLDEALAMTKDEAEVMIIGGAEIFTAALPLARRMHLTHIDLTTEGDTFFPEWEENAWHISATESHPRDAQNAYDLQFITYERSHD